MGIYDMFNTDVECPYCKNVLKKHDLLTHDLVEGFNRWYINERIVVHMSNGRFFFVPEDAMELNASGHCYKCDRWFHAFIKINRLGRFVGVRIEKHEADADDICKICGSKVIRSISRNESTKTVQG